MQYWKILAKQCCASKDNIIKKTGRSIPIICPLCRKSGESLSHIIWHCRFAKRIWNWAAGIFSIQPDEDLLTSYAAAKGRSRMIKDLWLVTNLGYMYNNEGDLRIMNYFRVQHRSSRVSTPVEVSWAPPNPGEIMICCDGASFGNPGHARAGVIFPDANSVVLGVLCVGLGWQTNLWLRSGVSRTSAFVQIR
ncbi:uncharacterized protein LOC113337120 [Papaver somniferum]|uniref:uncharacterized protein LOC113337120 n=1 Tax=Papaver somniferum TaxID=3469 RepID=UPI000E703421|nr:uncharacterized protein LOC113337120 [Papaver somniferum]